MPEGSRGVFVDCGAFDGCSVIKFKLANPEFDCISFEPNPILWKYFKYIPTKLIKKGISNKNEKMKFRIDHIYADGSSLISTKKVLYGLHQSQSEVKSIEIECISLANLIMTLESKYDYIILKLDVEGAEYDILEDLIARNLLDKLTKLYVEFHWQKCNFSEKRHSDLISNLKSRVVFEDWDALEFAVHKRSRIRFFRRNLVLRKFTNFVVPKELIDF
jgi:FkbM family methyltransferase